MNKNAIGAKLRELRGKRTLEAVASEIGISTSALGMYENGQRVPKDDIKVKLAKYYDVSIDIFFAHEDH